MKDLFFKKIFLIIVIILAILFSTGCWNRRELSEIGIIGAAAIDAEADKIKLTYEVITPKRLDTKSGDEAPASYFQSEGETIFEASRNSTLKLNKKLFWSHANVFYFNEMSAKDGLLTYLDFFNRGHESRGYVNIAIAKGESAYKIIGIGGLKGEVPSSYVEAVFENSAVNGKAASIKIVDFLKTYYEEGIEPVVGAIQTIKRNETELKMPTDKKEEYMPLVEGLAVFKEDILVGFFDGIQTRGFNFARDKIKSGIIVSASPDGRGVNSIEIIKSSGKLNVQIKDGEYYCTVKIEINGMLNEETGKEDISNLEAITKIENNTSENIKNEIKSSIKKAQEYKTDIFGFGQSIHKKYPAKWKIIKNDWNDIFSTLEIKVEVKTNIEKVGVSNEQLSAKEQK